MIVFFLALILGTPQGRPLSGAALDQKTYEVASLLRCPVCQGMSVADSPSTVALDMKARVRELLSRGYTQEQILSDFEESYGQFVLLKPKFRGVNALVWILPILVLIVGAIVAITTARRLSATDSSQPSTEDPYIKRVRELAERE
jgi:cytochrome c-type biogenesis protein CcmH